MDRLSLRTLMACALALFATSVYADDTDVLITELLYSADPTNLGGEFVEIHNRGAESVALGGWVLTDAIDFTFPHGTTLDAGESMVVARSRVDAESYYGVSVLGEYRGALSNTGDRILLQDDSLPRQVVDVVVYDDEAPWPADADGGGMSLELVDVEFDNGLAENWALGQPFSPGQENQPILQGENGELLITEIMYKPKREELRQDNRGFYMEDGDDAFGEYVELLNVTDAPVDLSGWVFTDGIAYAFPDGATVDPGAYVVVSAAPDMIARRHALDVSRVFGPFDSGELNDAGERLTLRDADGRVIDTVEFDDLAPWPTAPDAFGSSLELLDPTSDNSSAANWRTSQAEFPIPDIRFVEEQAGESDGWRFFSVTDEATSNRLYFLLSEPGEWLLDDVSLRSVDSDIELVLNGSFDVGDEGWEKPGNHETSFWSDNEGRGGGGVEHVVATGPGQNLRNCVMMRRIDGVAPDQNYELSFWYKHLSGSRSAIVRLAGGGLEGTLLASGNKSDLALDFSDSVNPIGVWTFADDEGKALGGRSDNWLASVLGDGQAAWTPTAEDGAVSDALTPGWCRSNGSAPVGDFPEGVVGTHGPSQLIWTAPSLGRVTLAGGLALMNRVENGDHRWTLRVDGRVVSEGQLSWLEEEFNSSNPKPFSSGSGGSDALERVVEAGDRVRISVEAVEGSVDSFVIFDLQASFQRGIASSPPLAGALGTGSPAQPNSVSSDGLPPLIRTLSHLIEKPQSSDSVPVIAHVVATEPLQTVELLYRFNVDTVVSALPMIDDGAHGDIGAGDGIYAATIPAQPSGTLVHYWVSARDIEGHETSFPYPDDPSPTQAFYHFDDHAVTNLPHYDLFLSDSALGQLVRRPLEYLNASLVIDGIAYPNIDVRFRGQGSLTRPKKQWKFRFNRHQKFDGNRHLETMANIPFVQKVIFDLFDHGGTLNLESEIIRVDRNGRFYGVYIAFEVPNASWLDKHGHDPAGEVYKARTINLSLGSSLYEADINTDFEYWWSWNKKIRSLERPDTIRELTENLNRLPTNELLPWMEKHIDLDHWFRRWALYIHMNVDDFAAHNYYMFLPGHEDSRWLQLAYDLDSGFTYNRVGALRLLYGDGQGSSDRADWQDGKFYNIVANNPTLRRIYFYTLAEVNAFYDAGVFFPIIDEMFLNVTADRRLDNGRWGGFMRSTTSEIRSVFAAQSVRTRQALDTQNLPEDIFAVCLPPGGEFAGRVLVHMGAPTGWNVVYTTDGRDPRLSDTRVDYDGPIWIDDSITLRAAAYRGFPALGNWTRVRDYPFTIIPQPEVGPFSRGDCDASGTMEISDAIHMLKAMFIANGGPLTCQSACDVSGEGVLDVTDPVHIIAFLFLGGRSPPQAPFPGCDVSSRLPDLQLGCQAISELCQGAAQE